MISTLGPSRGQPLVNVLISIILSTQTTSLTRRLLALLSQLPFSRRERGYVSRCQRTHQPPSCSHTWPSSTTEPWAGPRFIPEDHPVLGHSPRLSLPAVAVPSSSLTRALSFFKVSDSFKNLVKGTKSSLQFCSDRLLGPLKPPVPEDVGLQRLLPVLAVPGRADWSLVSLRSRESFHLVARSEPAC